MTTLLELIEAYQSGKTIERQNKVTRKWVTTDLSMFSFTGIVNNLHNFRVKKNPYKKEVIVRKVSQSRYSIDGDPIDETIRNLPTGYYKIIIEEIEE